MSLKGSVETDGAPVSWTQTHLAVAAGFLLRGGLLSAGKGREEREKTLFSFQDLELQLKHSGSYSKNLRKTHRISGQEPCGDPYEDALRMARR